MKKFQIYWEEFLPAANERLVYDLESLCRGYTVVYARSGNEAKRIWKRAFPRSNIRSCLDQEKDGVSFNS